MIIEEKSKALNYLKTCGFCEKQTKTLYNKYQDTEKNISIEYTTFGICKRCLNKKLKDWK